MNELSEADISEISKILALVEDSDFSLYREPVLLNVKAFHNELQNALDVIYGYCCLLHIENKEKTIVSRLVSRIEERIESEKIRRCSSRNKKFVSPIKRYLKEYNSIVDSINGYGTESERLKQMSESKGSEMIIESDNSSDSYINEVMDNNYSSEKDQIMKDSNPDPLNKKESKSESDDEDYENEPRQYKRKKDSQQLSQRMTEVRYAKIPDKQKQMNSSSNTPNKVNTKRTQNKRIRKI